MANECTEDTDNENRPAYRELCGPKGYPIIGNLLTFSTLQLHKQANEWQKEFGPIFQCTVLYKKFVFVSDLKLLKQTCFNEKNSSRVPTFFGEYILKSSIAMTTDRGLSVRLKILIENVLLKQNDIEGGNSYMLKPLRECFTKLAAEKGTVPISKCLREVLAHYLTKQVGYVFLSPLCSRTI